MSEPSREKEIIFLVILKYFYRIVEDEEIMNEIKEDRLFDMSDDEIGLMRLKLIAEKNAMMDFFDRSEDWVIWRYFWKRASREE